MSDRSVAEGGDRAASEVGDAGPSSASRRRATRPRRRSWSAPADVLSSVVSSQVDLHARYGGVVPEIASRAHVELLTPVVAEALVEAGVDDGDLDAVAATVGPGLVGVAARRRQRGQGARARVGRAVRRRQPPRGAPATPASSRTPTSSSRSSCCSCRAATRCSCAMEGHGRYRLLGSTIDDAAGEAFDKVARYLGLGYPGGPAIDRLSRARAIRRRSRFPRALLDEGFDFSFSGLKTSVVNHVRKHPDVGDRRRRRVVPGGGGRRAGGQGPAGGQGDRARRASCLGGGVAANSLLRERFLDACEEDGLRAFVPSRAMCTDNAAMVAAAGWWKLQADGPSPMDTGAIPGLKLDFS